MFYNRTPGGKTMHAFYGIPYAKSPVGDLRFKKPVPAGGWDGTFEAKEWIKCPQVRES